MSKKGGLGICLRQAPCHRPVRWPRSKEALPNPWGLRSASTSITQTDFPLCRGTSQLLLLVTQFSDVQSPCKPSDLGHGELLINRATGMP